VSLHATVEIVSSRSFSTSSATANATHLAEADQQLIWCVGCQANDSMNNDAMSYFEWSVAPTVWYNTFVFLYSFNPQQPTTSINGT
jgi:hypothetical protein